MMKRRTGVKIFLLVCMCLLMSQGILHVKAAETQNGENLQMVGGQIRTVEPMGLRMVASIQKTYLKELEQEGVVEYGIMLLPKKYLGNQELTVDGKYLYNGKLYKPVIVPAKKIFYEDENQIYFTAVLANIAKEKYKEEYAARPYVKVIKESSQENEPEQQEEVVYGNESIDRQIYQIAEDAIAGETESTETKEWLQNNIIDPIEKPEGPSDEDKNIAFQLGKVSTVTLYKKYEDGTVREISQFDKESFQPKDHLVKVELEDQPELFSEISEVLEKDNTMYFKLAKDDYVTKDGRSMEQGAIVEYGKISDNQVTTKYVTMQSLLDKMKENPSGSFKLTLDLDASQIPKAEALLANFSGTLDGQGHKITGLTSTLFGEIKGGTVKNLILENAQVTKNGGSAGAGILANNVKENSAIENVHISGSMNVTNRTRVGSIAGYFYGATIDRCSANVNITANKDCVGGLVGEHDNWTGINAYIKDSYAVGSVSGSARYVGGLIGWHKKLSIENCYAAVEMKSDHASNRVGGFTGYIKENTGDKLIQNNISFSTGGKGYKFDGMSANNMFGSGYQKNYTLLESDLTKDSDRFGEVANNKITEKSRTDLLQETFYTSELGWDSEVWDFTPLQEGKTPRLKGIDTNVTTMPGEDKQTEGEVPEEDTENTLDGETLEAAIAEAAMEEELSEPEATPTETEAAVAARYEEAQAGIELTAFGEVPGYQEERKVLYENLKHLMPFYNEEQIIKDGNKVDTSHVLNREKVLAVYPMDERGAKITGLTTKTAPQVNQIRIQFVNADITPLIYNVTYIDTRSDIASYEVSQQPIHYNFDKYIVNTESEQFKMLLDAAKGYDFEKDIKTQVAQQDVESVIHSYRRNYNETVKKEMEQVLISFVANNPQYPVRMDSEMAKELTKELLLEEVYLKDFLYAYNYVDRWYDFEIGGINIRDVVIFDNSLLQTTKKSRNLVTDITNNTSNGDRQGNQTSTLYRNRVAPYMGINSVAEFLEYFMSAYAGYEDVNNWIIDNFKGGVLVEAKPNNPKITTRMWHFIKKNTVQRSQELVLPLLSYKTSKNLYIASFPTALIYGNLQIYGDYQDSDAGREAKRQQLSNQVSLYRNIYDNFVNLASNGAASVNNSKFLIVDSSYNKDRGQDVFIEFYKPLQTLWGGQNGAVAYVFGDPNKDYIHYNSSSFIGDLAVLNHEMGHVTDAWIWMENKGKRPGRNGEDYSNGFANQANLDYNMNFMQNYARDSAALSNLTPARIDSPEEFQSYYKEVFETIYTLDYLQGLAYLELSPDQQAQITAQHHYGTKDAHQNANSANSTWDVPNAGELESMNLKTLDDLWDHQLTIRPGQRYDIKSQVEVGINNFGAYQLDRVAFSSWYVPYVNGATPNAQIFRRNGFELGGLLGYSDGLVEYLSGRTRTGDLAFYQSKFGADFSFENYRKSKNEEIEKKIKEQEEQGNPYFDEEALIAYFKQNLINYGNGIHTGSSNPDNTLQNIRASRENVFRYLQRITDEFRSPVYADNAGARQAVEISTAEQLVEKINEDPNGFYVLTQDISMESVEAKNGVYIDKTFIGKLEGRGHKITNAKAPLLRRISNSYVSDLTIVNQEGAATSLAQSESYTIRVNEVKKEKEISTLEELKQIGKNDYSKYILTADIDASEFTGDVLIGGNFSSVLEGNNHTITGLKATLFEKIDSGTVQNLKVTDVDITKSGEYAAAIAKKTNHAVLENISLENIKLSGTNYVAPVSGYDYTGSSFSKIQVRNADIKASGYYSSTFVGRAYGSQISDVAVLNGTVDVEQTENGGFIGSGNNITVERVYSDADITLTGYKDSERFLSAGFIGRIDGKSNISNVFAAGDVICEDEGKTFYKFTGTPDKINESVQNSFEFADAQGTSNVAENVEAGRLTAATDADKHDAEFYRSRMQLHDDIWHLAEIQEKGYPELKGMEDLGPIAISTAEELKNINEKPDQEFYLLNDIDLTGAEAGTAVVTEKFTGTLDGKGHSITGLKAPLFQDLSGAVQNLHFKNLLLENGSAGVNVLAVTTNAATVTEVFFNGITLQGQGHTGIIGTDHGSTFSKIGIQNVQLNAEADHAGIFLAEGTGTKLDNLVIVNADIKTEHSYVGGLAGKLQQATVDTAFVKAALHLPYQREVQHTAAVIGSVGENGNTITKLAAAGGVYPHDPVNDKRYKVTYIADESANAELKGITGSFVNTDTPGKASSADGITGVTEAELKTAEFYRTKMTLDEAVWNLEEITANGYPRLINMDTDKLKAPTLGESPQEEAPLESEVPEGYQPIRTAEELLAIANTPGGNYILMNSISLYGYTAAQGESFLGNFTGSLKGNRQSITDINGAPLFDTFSGTVEDLKIRDVTVERFDKSQGANAFAKQLKNATVKRVAFNHVVLAGGDMTATLAGITDKTVMEEIWAENLDINSYGPVFQMTVEEEHPVGGLIAQMNNDSVLRNSYVSGVMFANAKRQGGVIGWDLDTEESTSTNKTEYVISNMRMKSTTEPVDYYGTKAERGGFIGNVGTAINNRWLKNNIAIGDTGADVGVGSTKSIYRFTGASLDAWVLNGVENCYESSDSTGESSEKGEVIKAVNAATYSTSEFYQNTLHFSPEIWKLETAAETGHPVLKWITGENPKPDPEPEPDPDGEFPEVQNYPLLQEQVPAGYEGIYTAEDLKKIDQNPTGKYILMNNISMENMQAETGAYLNELVWPGILDGNNQVIHGLTDGSLFNNLKGDLKNLRIQNVKIDKGTEAANVLAKQLNNDIMVDNLHFSHIDLTGGSNTAVVAGNTGFATLNQVWIEDMQITVPKQEGTAFEKVGGVIGNAGGGTAMQDVYVEGTMDMDGAAYGGGIVGDVQKFASIDRTISNVRVKSSVPGHTNAGFVGRLLEGSIGNSITMAETSGDALETSGYKFSAQGLQLGDKVNNCYEVTTSGGNSSVTELSSSNGMLMSTAENHTTYFFEKLGFSYSIWNFDTVYEKGYPTLLSAMR